MPLDNMPAIPVPERVGAGTVERSDGTAFVQMWFRGDHGHTTHYLTLDQVDRAIAQLQAAGGQLARISVRVPA